MLPVLLCLALLAPPRAQRDPAGYGVEDFAPFDPRAWTSASGEWTLALDPSSAAGKGPARYVLRRGDEVAWQGERPFTLLRAAVGDRGDVVGYALTGAERRSEEILLTALAPDGGARWEVALPRRLTAAMHASPQPAPRAFAYDEAGDRFALRLYESIDGFHGGTWRFYRASTGEHVGTWYDGERAEVVLGRGATPELYARLGPAVQAWKEEWAGVAPPPRTAIAAPEVELELIAEVTLERGPLGMLPGGPIVAWEIERDAGGGPRFEIVRELGEGRFLLAARDEVGALLREAAVHVPDFEPGAWAHVGGPRWMAAGPIRARGAEARGFVVMRLDAQRGVAEFAAELPGEIDDVHAVAARADGAFAVTGRGRLASKLDEVLVVYDAAGREQWRRVARWDDPADAEDAMIAPRALAYARDGRLVSLDSVACTLITYGARGAVERVVSLAEAWGEVPPSYPNALRRGAGETWIVAEPDGGGARVVDAAGRPLEVHRVRGYAGVDRERGELERELRPAPDGTWWTSDGTWFVRANEHGDLQEALGGQELAMLLGRVHAAEIDRFGRILCVVGSTRAIHAWSADGAKLFVAVPAPGDLTRSPDDLVVLPGSQGGGLLARVDERVHVRFDGAGARVGFEELPLQHAAFPESGGGGWMWGWRGGPRWIESGGGADGSDLRIERLPDRRWIHHVDRAAPLEDGGIAVVARGELAFYARDGAPRGMARLATSNALRGYGDFRSVSAAGGKVVVRHGSGEVLLVDRETLEVHRLALPEHDVAVGLSPGGREVWVLDEGDLVLRRYALP